MRAIQPSMSAGMCPVGLPDIVVGWVFATSNAMSAPEFPTPTMSTRPSRSCDGFRYALECSWTIDGSRSAANDGTRGSRCAPDATTTFVASNVRSPADTT